MEDENRKKKRKELYYASNKNNNLSKIKKILKSDVTLVNLVIDNDYGWTALMRSAMYGSDKITEFLLTLPNINIQQTDNKYGNTALHYATLYGNANIVSLLLKHPHIDVNMTNKNGETPLHIAVQKDNSACIELLSSRPDIDMNIKNEEGKSALEYKYEKILALLPSVEMTKWNRGKIMLVGQGRAGKTALANNLMGRLFEEETASTIGANQMHVKMYYGRVKKGRLHEYERPEKEFEAHVLDLNEEIVHETTLMKGMESMKELTTVSTQNKLTTIERDEIVPFNHHINLQQIHNISRKTAQLGDEEMSHYKILLYDFGGQSIFNVLHPFFMSRYGVYLLVFDMELFLSDDPAKRASCHKELKFWLNSIAMHTYDTETRKTAPVAIIGTRRDKIEKSEDHEKISRELEEKYRGSEVWGSLIRNTEGKSALEYKYEKILALLPSVEMTKWNRGKIMLVGQGRAGKTALANNLMGRLFEEETASTIGANQMHVKMYYGRVKKGRLHEYERPEKEFEAHVLDLNEEIVHETTLMKGMESMKELTTVSTQNKLTTIERDEIVPFNHHINLQQIHNISRKTAQLGDEEMSHYKILLYDFGGQSIFNVLHPFFMSRYGVYLLVFDMELFLSDDPAKRASCHKELKFWLNSIAMHTYDTETRKTAPVAIIGTRRDKIEKSEDHEKISRELDEKYRGSEVWGSLIRNTVRFVKEEKKLQFFSWFVSLDAPLNKIFSIVV